MSAVDPLPLRVGVLGTGRIGSMHAELLAHRVPEAALAAVYDIDADLAAAVARPLGVEAARDADELIRSPDVDAVAICSSTDTHVAFVEAAAAAGKATFCEKPISHDLQQVDRALAAVERAGVLFMVGFNRRFDPAHRSVRDAVAAGEVGDVHILRITSRALHHFHDGLKTVVRVMKENVALAKRFKEIRTPGQCMVCFHRRDAAVWARA